MAYEHLTISDEAGIAVVQIDRPPANAMDLSLLAEGHACVEELEASAPDAVVVTGRPGFFSAGVDLKLAPALDSEGQRQMVEGINRLFADWYCYPGPVVAAVNGHAIAGGLILALCADHRVCGPSGSFGLTEVKAGIGYPAVAMAVVRSELSPQVARRLVLGGGLVAAEEGLAMGLFDELVDDDPLPRALEVARELAALPANAYARIKGQVRGETMALARRAVAEGDDPLLGGWLDAEAEQGAGSILG